MSLVVLCFLGRRVRIVNDHLDWSEKYQRMTITHDWEDPFGDNKEDAMGDWDVVSRKVKDESKTVED